jgi:hypothetical protein
MSGRARLPGANAGRRLPTSMRAGKFDPFPDDIHGDFAKIV